MGMGMGMRRQELLSDFLPTFEVYMGESVVGNPTKPLPSATIQCMFQCM